MASAGRIEDALDRIYENRFPSSERAERARLWETICRSFFDRYVPPGGTVLDVGAGYCDFINNVRAARRLVVDLNPDTVAAAAPGVEVHTLPLERLGEAIAPDSVDLAFASNVFEHLRSPDILLDILAALRVALRPGGRLIVMQPTVRALGGAFWDFVDHTLPLSDRGMAEALEISDYEIVERRARFLPYTTKSHLPRWSFLVRLYLAMRPAQWLMGKQMLLVARRPEA
jgi:SAM-dependent methyltransferase